MVHPIIIHPARDNSTMFDRANLLVDRLIPYQNQTIFLNYSSEWWGKNNTAMLNVCSALESTNYDYWILSHCPDDHLIRPRIVYYPWWHVYSLDHLGEVDIESKRSKFIGCLNGNPRPHRISNYFQLKEKFDCGQIYNTIFKIEPLYQDDIHSNDYEKQKFQNLLIESAHEKKYSSDEIIPQWGEAIQLPALDDAYIHLTAETNVSNRIFLSEKTWKPIAAGQLFVHFGNPGSIQHLRELGVDVFDDIINHSQYEHLEDWRQRLDAIHNLLNDVLRFDIESIWQETLPRRLLNKQKYFSKLFLEKYYHAIVHSKIETYASRGQTSTLDIKAWRNQ